MASYVLQGGALPTICSWCRCVRSGGSWRNVAVSGPAIHGICPSCFNRTLREFQQARATA